MRILHIDSGDRMRGGQWQALRLTEELSKAGHESVLLAPEGTPLLTEALKRGLAAMPLGVTALVRLAAGADVIHAHDARSHSLAAVTGREPLVVARRVGFPIQCGLFSRWKYAKARHYIAVSHHVDAVMREGGIPAEKISVVYDGVPCTGRTVGGGRIVAPATDDPAKGTALLQEAAAIAGLQVHYSNDLEADLRDAMLFVYVTFAEGLGSAALMAMAAGVPVVASRVGGLPEAVIDAGTGLLAENEPKEIADALRRLVDDKELRDRLGERGQERAREEFSVERMAGGTLKVYERVLKC